MKLKIFIIFQALLKVEIIKTLRIFVLRIHV